MATFEFDSLGSERIAFEADGKGTDGDVLDFGSASAAELRFALVDATHVSIAGLGKVVTLEDSALAGTLMHDLSSRQFRFDDGSQVLFASLANGLSRSLDGGSGADLLIGSAAPPLTLVTRTPGGAAVNGSGTGGILSADGRYDVFASHANNLSDQDKDGFVSDAYMRDNYTGALTLLSIAGLGPGDNHSYNPTISGDASTVAFLTTAGNLGFGDASTKVVWRHLGISGNDLTLNEWAADGSNADSVGLSADGTWAVYRSNSASPDNPDANGTFDVFVGTRGASAFTVDTELVSVTPGGAAANGESSLPSISGNGRYVAFQSVADNLVAAGVDTNNAPDIYLRDLKNDITTLISRTDGGALATQGSYNPAISANGRYVAFYSYDSLGVTGQTGGPTEHLNLFVRDLSKATGGIELVSADAGGTPRDVLVNAGTASGVKPGISGDGRYVVFASASKLLVPDDTDTVQDIFVKDLVDGSVARVNGTLGRASSPSISADGSTVSFCGVVNGFWQTYAVDNPLFHPVLAGGAGDDTYQIARAADRIVEESGGGIDSVVARFSYRLGANLENLELAGAARNGTGNSLDNLLVGNDADNKLDGRGGSDTASYRLASDSVQVRLALQGQLQDTGGAGKDTLISIENLIGSAFDDRLTGDNGANRLDGGAGPDRLVGAKGNDTYVVDDADDIVIENDGGGADKIESSVSLTLPDGVERLVLTGSAKLRGTGNELDNRIAGNSGRNTLDGRAGDDVLTGGGGADTFAITKAGGTDTITDFASGKDHLRLDAGKLDLGDGDARIEGAATRGAPGKFSPEAELVLFTNSVSGKIGVAKAAQVIGSANDDYADGDRRLFVVDNGDDTAVYRFTSDGDDAKVSAGELQLLAVLQGTTTALGDYVFA